MAEPRQRTGGIRRGSKHCTATDKERIIGVYQGNNSIRGTSNITGFPKSTVSRIIAKFESEEGYERTSGSGRPRKTTEADDRAIVRLMRNDRGITSEDILEQLPLLNVSVDTIIRRITESGEFRSYWKINKPFISENNRQIRVQWCRDRLHWPIEWWRKVLWSDESPYVLRYNRKKRVWRRHNERYKPFALKGTVKHDQKLMVWGCFAAHGVGNLYRVEGIMESEQYKVILREQLLPSAQLLFQGRDYTFQQDNDPKHTSRATRAYMDELGIDPEEWPSQSPDLNPIENLWSYLDWTLRDRQCGNLEELWEALQEGWYALDWEYLTKLADSMPRRLQAVIDNNGYPTKY